MKSLLPSIDPKKEEQKILAFLDKTLQMTGFKKLILGLSGGIDSTTSLYLARKALPAKNIFVAHLYYFQPPTSNLQHICSKLQILPQNQYIISIKNLVQTLATILNISNQYDNGRDRIGYSTWRSNLSMLRMGNIMARIRMVILFDLAKKHNALVCGTENKSEHLLGYFTRFGDEASDLEPIQHLYKSQVYQLAKYLKVPQEIINAKPTAGLWLGQTDEGQFGFTYEEADQVLYHYFDKKFRPPVIPSEARVTPFVIPSESRRSRDESRDLINKLKKRFPNAKKIISFARKNSFKHRVPYTL